MSVYINTHFNYVDIIQQVPLLLLNSVIRMKIHCANFHYAHDYCNYVAHTGYTLHHLGDVNGFISLGAF